MPTARHPWHGQFLPVMKTNADRRADRYKNLVCSECGNKQQGSYLEFNHEGQRMTVFCNGCGCQWRVVWTSEEAIDFEKRERHRAMYGARLSSMPKKEKPGG